jgi:hypothetical protein
MADDDTTRALRDKYGTVIHVRARGGRVEVIDRLAKREGRTRNQQAEALMVEALRARGEES